MEYKRIPQKHPTHKNNLIFLKFQKSSPRLQGSKIRDQPGFSFPQLVASSLTALMVTAKQFYFFQYVFIKKQIEEAICEN